MYFIFLEYDFFQLGMLGTFRSVWVSLQFSHSVVSDFETLWTAACQASLPFTLSLSLLKFRSTHPSIHLILCHPLLLLPSICPRIKVFSNELALCIRRPKCWSSSFSISPSNEYSVLPMDSPLGWTSWISLQSKGLSRVFSNTTVQKHQFFGAQLLYLKP